MRLSLLHGAKIPAVVAGILFWTAFPSDDARSAELTVRPERVLAVATADWNKDGAFDRALLLASEKEPDEVDLLIYLSASDKPNDMRLAVRKANIAWRGAMWGTQPALEVTGRGSLVITSGNEAIGRGRWTQKLTLAYLNKAFVVAGYTHASRDTLDLDAHSTCDVNLLTGSGLKNKKPFKSTAKAVAVADWNESAVPRECK